jgi:hypothetical protein
VSQKKSKFNLKCINFFSIVLHWICSTTISSQLQRRYKFKKQALNVRTYWELQFVQQHDIEGQKDIPRMKNQFVVTQRYTNLQK